MSQAIPIGSRMGVPSAVSRYLHVDVPCQTTRHHLLPTPEDRPVTAVIRRSLIQGICGVAVVAGLSVSSAIERPVELRMVGHQTDRVEQNKAGHQLATDLRGWSSDRLGTDR